MHHSKSKLTREEFFRLVFTKSIPFILLFLAIAFALSIYLESEMLSPKYKITLMTLVLVIFGYPILKKYAGSKLSKILPSVYTPLILAFKIISGLFTIFALIILAWYMPLVLLLFYFSLLFENYRLKNRIDALEKRLNEIH